MSKHRRFFVDPASIFEDTVHIDGPAARQIVTVLRLKVGDGLCVLDGSGNEYEACISSLSKNAVSAGIVSKTICSTEPSVNLTLAVCLPKRDRLDLVVGKCTELGISELVVVESERTVSRPDERAVASKLERWRRIARESAEQSERGRVPLVRGTIDFAELVREIEAFPHAIVAWEEEQHATLKHVLRDMGSVERLMYVVGPEGGFTEGEVASMIGAGAKSASLGKRLLRSETAAIAGAAAIMYELEE